MSVGPETVPLLVKFDKDLGHEVVGIGLILAIPIGKGVQRPLPALDQSVKGRGLAPLKRKQTGLVKCGVLRHEARGRRRSKDDGQLNRTSRSGARLVTRRR